MTYVKHGLNMVRLPPSQTFDSSFDAEIDLHCVGKSKPGGPGRVYQQHLSYIQHKQGLDTTPYDLFCQYLLWQLKIIMEAARGSDNIDHGRKRERPEREYW